MDSNSNSNNSRASFLSVLSSKCQLLLGKKYASQGVLPSLKGFRDNAKKWWDERCEWMLADLQKCYKGFSNFAVRLRTGKQGVKRGFWKNPRFCAVVLTGFLVLGNCYLMDNKMVYAVDYNGERIALISSQQAGENVRAGLEQELEESLGQDVFLPDRLHYRPCLASQLELDSLQQFKVTLQDLPWMTRGVEMTVNGKPLLALQDKKAGEKLLQRFQQGFVSSQGEEKVEDVQFQEKISFQECLVPASKVLTVEDALAVINGEQIRNRTYVVKDGDSLWSIARAHDLLVDDIYSANPELASERLDIGQELKLATAEPLLNVRMTSTLVKNEVLPSEVRTELDSSLRNGQMKVINPGADGEAQVAYRLVRQNNKVVESKEISRKVLKEPTSRVVAKGTRSMVAYSGRSYSASRGSGSGTLRWPVGGSISSGYGYRGGEFHGGIDIAAGAGSTVRAAAGGRVIAAGWDGGYGKTVVIDHGNGLATRYAHLSRINVSPGRSVGSGEKIGAVGSTGRSTGPHLHFEVLSNGSRCNPFNYLR